MREFSNENKIFFDELVLKIKQIYPDSVDLVGVYGSVARGDADRFSGADFVIIARDGSDFSLDINFIVVSGAEIGYSIKSTTWSEYEGYIGTVMQGAILQLVPLYHRDYDAIERFLKIKRLAEASLLLPLDEKKVNRIEPRIIDLKVANSDVQTSYKEMVKFYAIRLLIISTEILTELNCSYYRHSITERQKDVEMLTILPDKFLNYYNLILEKNDERDLKNYCNELTIKTCGIFDKLKKVYSSKAYIPFEGGYEKFIEEVNSKFIKSQVYADRKLSSVVGYKLLETVKKIEDETGVAFRINTQDAFNPSKLPLLLKAVKDVFEKEYIARNLSVKKYLSFKDALDEIMK